MIKRSLRWPASATMAAAGVMLIFGAPASMAQIFGPPGGVHVDGGLASLKTLQAPIPDLNGIISPVPGGAAWMRVLGKALFWDASVGSDGQACASCHFHAGVDPRTTNQISPGIKQLPEDDTFQPTASGGVGGPNYTLTGKDFPFHKLADVTNPDSAV